jgi:hypothetical protein
MEQKLHTTTRRSSTSNDRNLIFTFESPSVYSVTILFSLLKLTIIEGLRVENAHHKFKSNWERLTVLAMVDEYFMRSNQSTGMNIIFNME